MTALQTSPPLRYTKTDSKAAHRFWRASCGHHSLAAALGLPLQDVHSRMKEEWLEKRKAWMSPSDLDWLLRQCGATFQTTFDLQTLELKDGICRIQWEGPWLAKGQPIHKAYRRTHYIAFRGGWVLCTVLCPWAWIPERSWRGEINRLSRTSPATGWHVTHWYEIHSL